MQCRHCGTDIADKALICYRCGTATTESTLKPPASKPRSSWLTLASSVLALALLALLAVYLGRVPASGAPRSTSWAIVAFAVAVVILRAIARRSRR